MSIIFKKEEIINILKGQIGNDCNNISDNEYKFDDISGIAINSKDVKHGNIFIALPGKQTDGHLFIEEAFSNGAIAAIVNKDYSGIKQDNIIPVDNTLTALKEIAIASRNRFKGRVIGVTGTVGKTTIKSGIFHVLSKMFNSVYASDKSYNSQVGHPLSLANLDPNKEYAIFELGMSEKNGIAPLSAILRPEIGIITNISPVHMNSFYDVSDIMYTKLEIFKNDFTKIGILNRDVPMYRAMKEKASTYNLEKIITFGQNERASVRLWQTHNDEVKAVINIDNEQQSDNKSFEIINYKIPAIGEYWAHNSVAILSVCIGLGIDPHTVVEHLLDFHPIPGRGEMININGINIIDDSYNASPLSMRVALERLSAMRSPGRKIAIIGDMLDLGTKSDHYHREISKYAASLDINKFITCGDYMKIVFNALNTSKKLFHVYDSNDIDTTDFLKKGDTILIKGSNGMQMNKILDKIRTHIVN